MPAGVYARAALLDRFNAKVDRSCDCHIWTASFGSAGYGQIAVDGAPRAAHRVAWELEHGPVPAGMCVCHRCDVKACVNPAHLFLGTQADNLGDMRSKGREARGEGHGNASLSGDQVVAIRALSASGLSQRRIARVLGVSKSAVQAVIDGKTWRHLDSG